MIIGVYVFQDALVTLDKCGTQTFPWIYIQLLAWIFKRNCHQGAFLEDDHNDKTSNEVDHINLMDTTEGINNHIDNSI